MPRKSRQRKRKLFEDKGDPERSAGKGGDFFDLKEDGEVEGKCNLFHLEDQQASVAINVYHDGTITALIGEAERSEG